MAEAAILPPPTGRSRIRLLSGASYPPSRVVTLKRTLW